MREKDVREPEGGVCISVCARCVWPGIGSLCLLGSVHQGDGCRGWGRGGVTLEGLRAGRGEEGRVAH